MSIISNLSNNNISSQFPNNNFQVQSSEEKTQEDYFPLTRLTKCKELFVEMSKSLSVQDLNNLRITCKDLKNVVERDDYRNALEKHFLSNILEKTIKALMNLGKSRDGLAGIDESYQILSCVAFIAKTNPNLALKILSETRSFWFYNLVFMDEEDQYFFVEVLKKIELELIKTNVEVTKQIFIEIIEMNLKQISYPDDFFFWIRTFISFKSFDFNNAQKYIEKAKESFNRENDVYEQIMHFIKMGDLLKDSYPGIAHSFYSEAFEKTRNVQLGAGKLLIILTRIAKGTTSFSQEIAENIFNIYQNMHISTDKECLSERKYLLCYANEISSVNPEKALEIYKKSLENLIPKEQRQSIGESFLNLFKDKAPNDDFYLTFFELIPEKLLISLCESSPEKIQVFLKKENFKPSVLLKIANAFSSLGQSDFAKSLHQKAIEVEKMQPGRLKEREFFNDMERTEFVKKLATLGYIDEAINIIRLREHGYFSINTPAKAFKLLIEIAIIISSSDKKKALSLIDKILASPKMASFKTRIDMYKILFSIADQIADIVPDIAISLIFEALEIEEKMLFLGRHSLEINNKAVMLILQDPMKVHFLLQKYNFSSENIASLGLQAIDSCKHDSIKAQLKEDLLMIQDGIPNQIMKDSKIEEIV